MLSTDNSQDIHRKMGITLFSFDSSFQIFNRPSQLFAAIAFDIIGDFRVGMNNGGMITAAEIAADDG